MAVPALTHGSKMWTTTTTATTATKQEAKIETAQMKLLKSVAGYIRKDQIRNTNIREELNMKKDVFWGVAPCRNCVNRRFGGTYRLHLQGRRQEEILERTSRAGATD
jgi:hypothetical protein